MSSSNSLQWSLKEPEGLASVVNGDIYFSPNCTRPLRAIPPLPQRWKFVERVSTATQFQEARWWTAGTEWLGFVPRQPVPYAGVWFGPLNIIPNKLLCENQLDYGLPAFYSDKWLEIDYMLWETCEILRNAYALAYALPFPPRRWGYHKMFPTWSDAMQHITRGRDWFAMWIGLLYWSTRKIPNGADFAEGLTPPEWFKTVVFRRSQKVNGTYVDAIRTSQLLQNWWQVDRVGLFLHHPDAAPGQPPAQWLVQQNVPVWYRWGERECRSSRKREFPLITPSPELLQNATTWISASPTPYMSNQVYCDAYTDNGAGEVNDYSFIPMSPQSPSAEHFGDPSTSTSALPTTQASVTPVPLNDNPSDGRAPKPRTYINKDGFPATDYGSGRSVWEPFFRKQEERHERKLEKETPKQTQARLSRMRQPPRTSCPVYVWDWNDDEPPKFVRTRVRNDEREETLNSHSGQQSRYNAFDNEWDCCREWGEDPEEEDPVPPVAEHFQPPKSADELRTDRLATEVHRLLYEYYGWIAPIPLPAEDHTSIPEENRKSLIAILGLQSVSPASPFFSTPLAKAAMSFIRALASKDTERPSAAQWDLLEENRLCVAYYGTVKYIRPIRRDKEIWYMFDFGAGRTVPWNLAVPTAAAAVLVCRLTERQDAPTKNKLDESTVARELVLEGVRFHTVVSRNLLEHADPEPPTTTYLPMRFSDHIFNTQDHEFYCSQCKEIMSSPRARAALMRGGFVRRLALRFMNASEALRGPCGLYDNPNRMFVAKDANNVEYVDDELSDDEYDMLAGLYYKFTGEGHKLVKVCWYPQCWIYDGSGLDLGRWTEHAEQLWKKRTDAILNDDVNSNLRVPLNVTEWRSKLRGLADARRAWAKVEKWSKEFLRQHIGTI